MLANTPYKIVGENKSAVNALSEIAALQPDIVITDISMPEMTGVELVRRLKQQNSSLKILVLCMFDNPASLGGLMHSNISGFVLKDKGKDELIYAIERVSKSQIYFSQ